MKSKQALWEEYRIQLNNVDSLIKALLSNQMSDTDKKDIVRAVNCHEELLALITELRDLTFTESRTRTKMTLRVDQAIAKAEGK